MAKLPTPDETHNLSRILPIWRECLDYCAYQAVELNEPGSLGYDAKEDIVVYHLRVSDLDSSLFDLLKGTSEIWIITGAGTES